MSETYDLLSMSKNNSKIAGIVGWINLKDPGLDKTLSSFNNEKKLVGFREILQAEEPEFMLEDSFIQGVKLIGEKGYSYDILVFPKHLNAVLKLLHRLPEQRLVIDHLAKPNISAGEVELWAQSMKKISQFSHVSIKLSGMVTEASQHWKPSDFVFYMETIFKYFGEDRILFGSDWPVCLLRAEYKEVYELALNYVRDHSSTAEKKVFGENALRFYNLSR
jgi:L-fuconolactonase